MSNTNTPSVPEPIEMLAEWEGPAILNPILFAGPKELEEFLADPGRIGEATVWVTFYSRSAIANNTTDAPFKTRVVGFLADWRRRHGPAKLDELKQQVLRKYERGKADPAETRRRIDALFAEAEI